MNVSRSPSGARSRTRRTFTRCPAGQCKALTERGHRADPGLNLALGQMAVPDQPPAASAVGQISMGCEKSVQFRLNRLHDQPPSTLAQRVRRKSLQAARNATTVSFIMWHIVRRRQRCSNQWRIRRQLSRTSGETWLTLSETCGASTPP